MHNHTIDSLYEYKNNSDNEWTKFIIENTKGENEHKDSNDNDEYINDFDKINSFVISKCQSENKKIK